MRPALAVVVVTTCALVGCSKSAKTGSTTTTTASSSTASTAVTSETTAPAGSSGDVKAFVDIQECTNAGGSGTATGSIENTGDRTTTYELEIEFRDSSSGKALNSGTVEIPSLPAGGDSGWSVTTSGLGSAEVSCHTLKLTGTPG